MTSRGTLQRDRDLGKRAVMKQRAWFGVAILVVLGCDAPQQAPVAPAAPTAAPSSAPAPSAAPTPKAPAETANAAASTPVAPAEPKLTDEERFWSELGDTINREVKACATGWTGDGEVTIKSGRIVKVVVDGQPVRSLVGKASPPVPAPLVKRLEKPVSISVCVGGPKIAHD